MSYIRSYVSFFVNDYIPHKVLLQRKPAAKSNYFEDVICMLLLQTYPLIMII